MSQLADRTIAHVNPLWMLVIPLVFGLTLAFETFDQATIRIAIIILLCMSVLYFSKLVLNLTHTNQRLIRDLDSHAKMLSEKNTQISRLRQLSESLISQVDLNSALDLALEMATDVIGARTASIMLIDPGGRELYIAAARGLPEEVVRTARVEVGKGLAGLVAEEGNPIVINSDELDERIAYLAKRTNEIKSAVIMPIKVDGHTRGVINMSDKNGAERWDEEDLSVISSLAGQAAMAIQKIELYDNLQKQVVMLEETLSELKDTQAGLIQSEKLASIGQIAGGVAHEINNPLLVILGRAEFALEKLSSDNPAARDLEIIRTQTERIAEIVKNLLNYSRTSKVDNFQEVDVNAVIEGTLALTENQMSKHNIAVVREFDPDIRLVRGNLGHLQQVFVNLAINAYQAMSRTGGTLLVSTRPENGSVLMEFADTGTGIPLEDRDRIFEPFYTTNDETEGTGLGLAISRGIIHAHGGRIEVRGEPGKGTVFAIELPSIERARTLEVVTNEL